jgi:hypothetical protein
MPNRRGRKPTPASQLSQVEFKPGELERLRSDARVLAAASPADLRRALSEDVHFARLICRRFLENPPIGRSGAATMMRAAQESLKIAQRLLATIEAQERNEKQEATRKEATRQTPIFNPHSKISSTARGSGDQTGKAKGRKRRDQS